MKEAQWRESESLINFELPPMKENILKNVLCIFDKKRQKQEFLGGQEGKEGGEFGSSSETRGSVSKMPPKIAQTP